MYLTFLYIQIDVEKKGYVEGSIEGISSRSRTEKLWLVAQALGDISYSYPFSTILLEIQDTLKSPPPENQTMKKASVISVAITTFFYLGCGGAGYAAFGNDTPGNLLTGFGSSKYYWLVNFANVCIVVHLVGAYQVYSQPLFAIVENWFAFNTRIVNFVNHSYFLKLSFLPNFSLNFLRLSFFVILDFHYFLISSSEIIFEEEEAAEYEEEKEKEF